MCVYSLRFVPLNRNGTDLSHQNLFKWVTLLGNFKKKNDKKKLGHPTDLKKSDKMTMDSNNV